MESYCQAQPILKRKIPSEDKFPPKYISPPEKPFKQIQAQCLVSEFYGTIRIPTQSLSLAVFRDSSQSSVYY